MTGPRGKRRPIAEILSQERSREGTPFYLFRARLTCGHTVRVGAHNRYRKHELPSIGYCIECYALDVGAA